MLSSTESLTVEEMPVTPVTLKNRFSEGNYPVYRDFCTFFVSGVVGIRHFDRNKCLKQYSKYVTVSDEAFTVLTLENNWDRWSSMAGKDDWKESDVPSKWTTSKEKRKTNRDNDDSPQARKFRGWSAQGIARYNQLFIEIKNEREKTTYHAFEDYCIEEFEKEAEEMGQGKHKRRKMEPDKPLPIAKHELWDDEIKQDDQASVPTYKVPAALKGLEIVAV
jgi:hypothetical protein